MRSGRTLMAGLGWAATLGGLALCVLIFLAAYLAFDDHGAGMKLGKDEIILPSVREADVPRVPLGRPARGSGGGDDDGAAPTPRAPGGGSPPPVGALTPPAPP
jgi:hypothetical protein